MASINFCAEGYTFSEKMLCIAYLIVTAAFLTSRQIDKRDIPDKRLNSWDFGQAFREIFDHFLNGSALVVGF